MRKAKYALLALCVAGSTLACADDRTANTDRPSEPGAGNTAGTSGRTAGDADAAGDLEFIEAMSTGSQTEVELAELAQQKATDKQIREFAATMIRDHQKADAELKVAARKANIAMPTADKADKMEDHRSLHVQLGRLSGSEFDREYIRAMVEDHEQTVNDIEAKAGGAANDHVKQWAARTLPIVQKHLERAKQIHDALERR